MSTETMGKSLLPMSTNLSESVYFAVKSDDGITPAQILEREQARFERYREYWELYKGNHWSENELDVDKPVPVWNKVATYVNKSVAFLVGKPFKVKFPNKEIQDWLMPYVQLILDSSGGTEMFGNEIELMIHLH